MGAPPLSSLWQHELRNLAQALEALQPELSPRGYALLRILQAQAQQVLVLSEQGPHPTPPLQWETERQWVALRPFLEGLLAVVQPLASQRRAEWVCSLSTPPGTHAWLHTGYMGLLLINLLTNAAKFTLWGTVELGATAAVWQGQQGLRFWVRDTGVGFSASHTAKAHLPIASHNQGLQIAELWAQAMGGHIAWSSVSTGGTLAEGWVPTAFEAATQPTPPSAPTSPTAWVLAPFEALARSWCEAVAELGYRGHTFSDPSLALHHLFTGLEPNLLVVDADTPAMPYLRRVLPSIGLNAGSLVWVGKASPNLPNALHLPKPLQTSDLQEALRLNLPEPAPTTPLATPTNRPVVLLAEDSPLVQQVVARQLADLGAEVRVATFSFEALEWAQRQAFHIAILDHNLEPDNGPALARKLKQLQPYIELYGLTGAPPAHWAPLFGAEVGLFKALASKPLSAETLANWLRPARGLPHLDKPTAKLAQNATPARPTTGQVLPLPNPPIPAYGLALYPVLRNEWATGVQQGQPISLLAPLLAQWRQLAVACGWGHLAQWAQQAEVLALQGLWNQLWAHSLQLPESLAH
jgi:CheY-like chemotaxis protein